MYMMEVLTVLLGIVAFILPSKNDFWSDTLALFGLNLGEYLVDYTIDAASKNHPYVSRAIAVAPTIIEIILELKESATAEVSYIDSFECIYLTTMISTMRYIFIKPQGAIDEGNQILGYAGNQTTIHVECQVDGMSSEIVDGHIFGDVDEIDFYGVIHSRGYNDSYAMAADLFYKYHELGYLQTQLVNYHFVAYTNIDYLIDTSTHLPTHRMRLALPLFRVW